MVFTGKWRDMTGVDFKKVWPQYSAEELAAVTTVLESGNVNYWTGSHGGLFEQEYAEACGISHAVAMANGTLALEAALRAAGVGSGDEVVVSARSFFASASAIVAVGAAPVFADIDANSQNITAETVAPLLTAKTRAVICVHLAGWPCDMDALQDLAAAHDLALIEDCAQAHGATYKGRAVGALGHVAAFSFCQDKIISTGGEGGMLVTDNPSIWKCAWEYKDHGKSWAAVSRNDHPEGFRWLHESFGSNWRMTEMQAAIGRIQLKRLPEWLERRSSNAAYLNEAFQGVSGIRVTLPPSDIQHAYYKYYFFVEPSGLKADWDRDRIMREVGAAGVFCQAGSCPEMYLEKAFDGHPSRPSSRLPVARELGETSLMLLVDPTISEQVLTKTADAVIKVMVRALR